MENPSKKQKTEGKETEGKEIEGKEIQGKEIQGKDEYIIFVDFDQTLIDNHLDEDTDINKENFVKTLYDNKENYKKIKIALNELKKNSNYKFYVLSRNENKSLKDLISTMFPDIFEGIFLNDELAKIETTPEQKRLSRRDETLLLLYSFKKKNFAQHFLKEKKNVKYVLLIDDTEQNILSFCEGTMFLQGYNYNKETKYLNDVLNELPVYINKFLETNIKNDLLGSTTKPDIKNNQFRLTSSSPKNLFGSPSSPDIKNNLFGSPSSPDIKNNLFGSPSSPDIKNNLFGSPDTGKKRKSKRKSRIKSRMSKRKSKRKSRMSKRKSKRHLNNKSKRKSKRRKSKRKFI